MLGSWQPRPHPGRKRRTPRPHTLGVGADAGVCQSVRWLVGDGASGRISHAIGVNVLSRKASVTVLAVQYAALPPVSALVVSRLLTPTEAGWETDERVRWLQGLATVERFQLLEARTYMAIVRKTTRRPPCRATTTILVNEGFREELQLRNPRACRSSGQCGVLPQKTGPQMCRRH